MQHSRPADTDTSAVNDSQIHPTWPRYSQTPEPWMGAG